jgi:hypothetical protein
LLKLKGFLCSGQSGSSRVRGTSSSIRRLASSIRGILGNSGLPDAYTAAQYGGREQKPSESTDSPIDSKLRFFVPFIALLSLCLLALYLLNPSGNKQGITFAACFLASFIIMFCAQSFSTSLSWN